MSDRPNEVLFEQAKNLFGAKRYEESRTSFEESIQRGYRPGLALFYLGLIELNVGNDAGAREHFAESIASDPKEAESHFYLAELQYKIGDMHSAHEHYLEVRSLQPSHERAKNRLAELEEKLRPPTKFEGDIYDLLRQSKEDFAVAAVRLIDEIRIVKKPILLSAFVGMRLVFILPIVFLLILCFGNVFDGVMYGRQVDDARIQTGPRMGDDALPPSQVQQRKTASEQTYRTAVAYVNVRYEKTFGFFLAAFVVFILYRFYIRKLKSTLITVDRGVIVRESGLFTRTHEIFEVYRVLDFRVHQDYFNMASGDGCLILVLSEGKLGQRVHLKGLASYEDLKALSLKLRSLHLQLRSTNVNKGIMY